MNMPSVTSPTAFTSSTPADEDPWTSAPVSRANSVHLRRRNRTRTNPEDMAPSSVHPLSGATTSSTPATAAAADASRPTLRRLTTENERQVAETSRSGSERGASLDLLRMTCAPEADGVEVLIHEVGPNDSLAGVSLQYGIDLAVLRKANKLWASDTVHSRKSLYIPLEACRWSKATETFARGPDANQVTLTAKSAKRQGKQAEASFSNLHLLDADRGVLTRSTSGSVYGGSEWGEEGEAARAFMPDTNAVYEPAVEPPPRFPSRPPTTTSDAGSTSSSKPPDAHATAPRRPSDPSVRVLNIIRLPSSQLQFFPKSQSQDDSGKLDRRPSLPSSLPQSGKIRNNLHSLPPQLKAGKASLTASQTSTVVRLRPPTSSQSTPSSSRTSGSTDLTANIASRLTSLFTVPPPPRPNHARASTDSGYTSPKESRRPSANLAIKAEALELHPRRSTELSRNSGLRPSQADGDTKWDKNV